MAYNTLGDKRGGNQGGKVLSKKQHFLQEKRLFLESYFWLSLCPISLSA
jgi:hypothetical protein